VNLVATAMIEPTGQPHVHPAKQPTPSAVTWCDRMTKTTRLPYMHSAKQQAPTAVTPMRPR